MFPTLVFLASIANGLIDGGSTLRSNFTAYNQTTSHTITLMMVDLPKRDIPYVSFQQIKHDWYTEFPTLAKKWPILLFSYRASSFTFMMLSIYLLTFGMEIPMKYKWQPSFLGWRPFLFLGHEGQLTFWWLSVQSFLSYAGDVHEYIDSGVENGFWSSIDKLGAITIYMGHTSAQVIRLYYLPEIRKDKPSLFYSLAFFITPPLLLITSKFYCKERKWAEFLFFHILWHIATPLWLYLYGRRVLLVFGQQPVAKVKTKSHWNWRSPSSSLNIKMETISSWYINGLEVFILLVLYMWCFFMHNKLELLLHWVKNGDMVRRAIFVKT